MNSIHRLSTNVKEKKRTVAIGVHNQYELDAAVPVMNIIGKMYPNFEPEITMMPFKSLDNLLEENKLQIIFAIKAENETAKAECFTELCECPVMLLCRKDDELSGRKSININDINGRRVILVNRPKCPDAAMEGYMKLGMPNNSNVLLADGCEVAFAMTKAGLGVTAFPMMPCMSDSELEYIRIEGLAPVLFGIYSKKLIKGEPAYEFVTEAKKFYKNYRYPIDKTKTV